MELPKKESGMNSPETSNEIQMNAANLYLEEVFTDNAVGTLRRLSPVTPGGDPDATRSAQYIGATQVTPINNSAITILKVTAVFSEYSFRRTIFAKIPLRARLSRSSFKSNNAVPEI